MSNFKESHSAAWGAMTSHTHRALYARLDSQARAAVEAIALHSALRAVAHFSWMVQRFEQAVMAP